MNPGDDFWKELDAIRDEMHPVRRQDEFTVAEYATHRGISMRDADHELGYMLKLGLMQRRTVFVDSRKHAVYSLHKKT